MSCCGESKPPIISSLNLGKLRLNLLALLDNLQSGRVDVVRQLQTKEVWKSLLIHLFKDLLTKLREIFTIIQIRIEKLETSKYIESLQNIAVIDLGWHVPKDRLYLAKLRIEPFD